MRQLEVTVDDPGAYARPFTARVNQHPLPDAEPIELIRNESEKSVRYRGP